jgi:hypothetical protein
MKGTKQGITCCGIFFLFLTFGVEPVFGVWVFFVNMLNILMRKKADTRAAKADTSAVNFLGKCLTGTHHSLLCFPNHWLFSILNGNAM